MNFLTFTLLVLGSAAVYSLGLALIVQTKNVTSAVIFKVIPFFLGLGLLVILVKMWGILN